MSFASRTAGYVRQFIGEVIGSQKLYEKGRRDVLSDTSADGYPRAKEEQMSKVVKPNNPGRDGPRSAERDAEPQFHRSREGASNDGVSSAKPRVITGSDDATRHKYPPGAKEEKDWSPGFDESQPAKGTKGGDDG